MSKRMRKRTALEATGLDSSRRGEEREGKGIVNAAPVVATQGFFCLFRATKENTTISTKRTTEATATAKRATEATAISTANLSSRSPSPRSAYRSRTSPPCHPSLTPARRRRPSDSLLGLARTSSISCSTSAGLTEVGSSCPWISLTGGSRSSRSEPGRIPVTSKVLPCDRQVQQLERHKDIDKHINHHFLLRDEEDSGEEGL
ncbi:uncharacterized protein LOC121991458 [Zingiber officinale]|uniref:uncharacterized protein LOC121991458 n=1 Tax=Zingiber officinale TaxID=94328 RepID=UPI001C4AC1AB|nr:uncharacterized protein LOC121991458 [Zingiber officinale]